MSVIEHGRRRQLSIARFTQEKGAASSFHTVLDRMLSEFAHHKSPLLVGDKRKASMMIQTLNS